MAGLIRRFKEAIWVVQELIYFGRAEERNIDLLLENERKKLAAVQKLNEDIDEQLRNISLQMMKESVNDIDSIRQVVKMHEQEVSAHIRPQDFAGMPPIDESTRDMIRDQMAALVKQRNTAPLSGALNAEPEEQGWGAGGFVGDHRATDTDGGGQTKGGA